MRAVLFDRYGDYSELRLVTRDRPLPSAGELLVHVTVAAVNPIDSTIRLGRFPAAKPPPLVLGQEACGVVVGGADSVLTEGTRVLVRGGFGTATTRYPPPESIPRSVSASIVLPHPISPVIRTSPPSCVRPKSIRARASRWSER